MNLSILLGMVCAGVMIGIFYFGGLWLTLNKLTGAKRWVFWLGAGFLVRSSITMTAFWFLAAGDWQRIVALATGFTIVRFFSIKRIEHKPLPTS